METGYDLEPRPIRGSARGRVWLVVLAVGVFLGVVLVKPWVTPPTTPVEAGIASQRPVASPAFAVIPIQPAPVVTPVWPAAAVASKHAGGDCDGGRGRAR